MNEHSVKNMAIIPDCAAINRLDLRLAATHVRSPEYSPEASSAVGGVLSTPGRSTSQKPVAASFTDPVPGSRSLAVREAWRPRAGALRRNFASAIACVVLPRLLCLCLRGFFLISSPRFCFRDVARASAIASSSRCRQSCRHRRELASARSVACAVRSGPRVCGGPPS
ncbi:uncharacterized protein SCHCODRAFT_02480891, partial [Schizophyllum commune H4-8]|uniref:uncharacterized protein n=1 Tax=Schizophyllum commune (strain H4-8 / FGSC 9210) TaxID=578458 RepID=UPI00215EE716